MWPMLFRRVEAGKKCEPLDTRPILFLDLKPIWDAFWILSNTRGYSESGASPISMVDIKAYLDIFSTEDKFIFVQNIYLLDSEYLQYSRGRTESEQEQADKKQQSKVIRANDGRNHKRRY